MSALGIQLDEFGLPLVNAMVNASSGRPNIDSLPDGEPCISTVSLRGKSLSEINRLWLADINAKGNSTTMTLTSSTATATTTTMTMTTTTTTTTSTTMITTKALTYDELSALMRL
jgi:hypothetical protein